MSVFLNDLCDGYLAVCGMYINSIFYDFLLLIDAFSFTEAASLTVSSLFSIFCDLTESSLPYSGLSPKSFEIADFFTDFSSLRDFSDLNF